MIHQVLKYRASGLNMASDFYALPGGSPRPGVLIFPGGGGVSDLYRGHAQKLAELGYAALACDLHGDARITSHDKTTALPLVESLLARPDDLRARAQGAFDALAQRPEVDKRRIAAMGYCLGGVMAFELARGGADLRAICGIHTGVTKSKGSGPAPIKAKVLVMNGSEDPTVTEDQYRAFRHEMTDGGVDWQLHFFGGVVHSYTIPESKEFNSPTSQYDPRAAARAWVMMRDFFAEAFAAA